MGDSTTKAKNLKAVFNAICEFQKEHAGNFPKMRQIQEMLDKREGIKITTQWIGLLIKEMLNRGWLYKDSEGCVCVNGGKWELGKATRPLLEQ